MGVFGLRGTDAEVTLEAGIEKFEVGMCFFLGLRKKRWRERECAGAAQEAGWEAQTGAPQRRSPVAVVLKTQGAPELAADTRVYPEPGDWESFARAR